MSKKYELTEETLEWNGHTLHRIRALRDVGDDVQAGDLGGWVESEANLSHYGTCWLYDEAKAYGEAELSENARAFDNAQLSDNAYASCSVEIFSNAHLSGNTIAKGKTVFGGDMYATREAVYISGLGWGWPITISDNHIKIGCQIHTIDEWAKFSYKEIAAMDVMAIGWWITWGNIILTIARNHQKEEE